MTDSEKADSPDTRRLRVLIADDEPLIRRALQRLFQKKGHDAAAVEDAHSALALLAEERFDAVLVDLRMPGNGMTVIRHLDADPEFDGVVALMTGDLSADAIEQMGPRVHLLQKPFKFPDVVPLIEERARG